MLARRLASSARPLFARRGFASGHGHAEKHYEGMEAAVRQYLPENHHIVLGVLGAYAGLYVLVKLAGSGSKGKKKEAAPAPHGAADKGLTEMPSILSEGFDKWSQQPGNMAKWEASLESWEKGMENPVYAGHWAKASGA